MESPNLLRIETVESDRRAHFVDTLYGGQVGLRRMSTGQVMKILPLFATIQPEKGGPFVDSLGIGFRDVECPACQAEPKQACDAFGDEAVPHEARAKLAQNDRYARACRMVLRASVTYPAMSQELIEFLESKPEALVDLIAQVMRVNGLAPEVQAQTEGDFRPRDNQPEAVPAAS